MEVHVNISSLKKIVSECASLELEVNMIWKNMQFTSQRPRAGIFPDI